MTDMNDNTTIDTKKNVERVVYTNNVIINHYYSDNGLFKTKSFKDSVENMVKLYPSVA